MLVHDSATHPLIGVMPEDELLVLYANNPDPKLESELAARFEPLVRSLALRYRGGAEPTEDLIQVARLALIKALRRYDPSKGNRFVAFAAPTILGELRRHFRDHAWRLRLPRQLQERSLELRKAADALGETLGRVPTVQELGARLGLADKDIIEVLLARDSQNALSFDREAPGDEPGMTLGESTGRHDPALEAVDAQLAAERCAGLEPREREVLSLRFDGELSQREIGERIGVSQMQVSRIMRRALAKLLEAVQGDESPDGARVLGAAAQGQLPVPREQEMMAA